MCLFAGQRSGVTDGQETREGFRLCPSIGSSSSSSSAAPSARCQTPVICPTGDRVIPASGEAKTVGRDGGWSDAGEARCVRRLHED